MRMDGPCCRRREGEQTAELQRREASRKLARRDGSTLMRATISLLLSFFVGGSLTTKEGDGLVRWQGRGTWVHRYRTTTETWKVRKGRFLSRQRGAEVPMYFSN